VAGQTQPHRLSHEQTLDVGNVGIVAIQAGATRGDGVVGDGCVVYYLFDGVVTVQAQLRRRRTEESLVIRAVRVMARAARTIADRWVHVIALIKRQAMALQAELSLSFDAEQGGVVGPMWVVA
jgi:hypothetical protein